MMAKRKQEEGRLRLEERFRAEASRRAFQVSG